MPLSSELLTLIEAVLPLIKSPGVISVSLLVLSGILFVLGILIFYWQNCSQSSKENLLWAIFLVPFILYIPVNLALLSVGMVELRLNDFGAYYNAATRWVHGVPLYQTTQEIHTLDAQSSEDMPYLYPPIFVLIFVPFTLLPPFVSGIVWNILILMFLIWSVSKLVSTFEIDVCWKRRFLLYLLVASFAPTITWIKLGQVSGLLVGLLCLCGATLRSDHYGVSGIFATLGTIVKPFYLTSGAYLLRRRESLLSAILTGMVLIISGILVFGINTHLEYIEVLQEGKGWETVVRPENWHATHFNPFYVLGPLKHLPRIILVLGAAGLALYSNRLRVPVEYIFSLGVSIVPIVGPTTNTLALSTAIPAIIMTSFYELENGRDFPKVIAVSALLIHIHPYTIEFLSKFGPQIYEPLEIITPIIPIIQPAIYGMALLVGYITYRSLENIAVRSKSIT